MWPQLKNIYSINIHFSSKGINDLEVLNYLNAILEKAPSVKALSVDFDGCIGTDLCVTSFFRKRLCHMQRLESLKLRLDSTRISNESLECLSKDVLPFMKCLETLNIGLFNVKGITDDGLLAVLESCKDMKTLYLQLQIANITSKCIEKFSTDILAKMQKLTTLSLVLTNLPIADKNIEQLLTNIHNIQILDLYLDYTKVSDESMKYFMEKFVPSQKCLKSFYILAKETQVTSNTLKKIEEFKVDFDNRLKR